MIKRLYVHNFRCLENFELVPAGPSILLIGQNGSGKTTVRGALQVLQRIARGSNRLGDVATSRDFWFGRTQVPMRFELEVELEDTLYHYVLALELPPGFKELRILEESLSAGRQIIYSRQGADVELVRAGQLAGAKFRMDWHVVALPLIQASAGDPSHTFRQWLANMLLIQPIPNLIVGDSDRETLHPEPSLLDFAAWFSGLISFAPAVYGRIDAYLKEVMPDLRDIQNIPTGGESRSLQVRFSADQVTLPLPFGSLSDGEKCFMISALVVAANEAYGPLFCFWDEPDSHLSLSEVGHFVIQLRKSFENSGGQLIATSHNPETIRKFSDENTCVLLRKSHLEPTQIRLLSDLEVSGDLVGALIRGDLPGDS